MKTTERRAAIQSSLKIAPRPKMADEKIDQLLELLHEARETGDEVLLIQVIQQATGALATIHAARIAEQN